MKFSRIIEILITNILVLVSTLGTIFLVLYIGAEISKYIGKDDEENKSNSSNEIQPISTQNEASNNTIQWTEKDRFENDNLRNQLIRKFEVKMLKLGFKKVSSIRIGVLNSEYATLFCPVKRGGDKVYSLTIFFKKYTDFEIIKVELFDEGNMTKMQLE